MTLLQFGIDPSTVAASLAVTGYTIALQFIPPRSRNSALVGGLLALLGMARALVLVPALIFAASHSVLAVAMTLVGVTVLTTGVNLALAGHLLRVRWRAILRALGPSLVASTPLLIALVLWGRFAKGLPEAVQLAAGTLLGVAVYLLAVSLVAPEIFRRAAELARRRAPASNAGKSPAFSSGAVR